MIGSAVINTIVDSVVPGSEDSIGGKGKRARERESKRAREPEREPERESERERERERET